MKEKSMFIVRSSVEEYLSGDKDTIVHPMMNSPSYPGISKMVYMVHPFSESCLKGTPAEGEGIPNQKAWCHEDWCGNIVGVQGESPYVVGDIVSIGEGKIKIVKVTPKNNEEGFWFWVYTIRPYTEK